MGQPPARPYTWTYSEYARFPDDGNRYEVLDGEVLVTPAPSPRHQRIVEVLSPTSGAIDRVKKPRRYRDFGVPEYWVVDPEEQVIWVWRFAEGQADAERQAERLTWQPAGATEAITIEIRDLFRPL